MATMFDFGFLQENLVYVELFGQNWIIPLVFVFLCCIIISRRPQHWTVTFLPILIGVRTMGIYFSLPFFTLSVTLGALLFAVNALGTDTIGGAIRGSISDTKKRYGETKGESFKFSKKGKIERKIRHDEQLFKGGLRLSQFYTPPKIPQSESSTLDLNITDLPRNPGKPVKKQDEIVI